MHKHCGIVCEFVEEVLNKGKIESTGDYFWEDMVEQAPFPGQGPALRGLKEVLSSMRAAFPDIHWTIQEQMVDGDRVLTRFEWTGTHQGEILGIPPTGRQVKVWGMVIDRFVNDKIKETRLIFDSLGMLDQLGVVPHPCL